jgi:hypothetical protein
VFAQGETRTFGTVDKTFLALSPSDFRPFDSRALGLHFTP